MIVKVCGMRNALNIREVDNLDIDWMGFIFYPQSARYVAAIPSYLPVNAKRVGVFVNESFDNIISTCNHFSLDIVQLHGDETPEQCYHLSQSGLKVMKAFSIIDKFPTALSQSYQQVCHYFLFDTQTVGYGGSGKKFDWASIADYQGNIPFLLSGGISVADAKSILQIHHPQLLGVDINSRFESEPALKNVELVKQFLKQINHNE